MSKKRRGSSSRKKTLITKKVQYIGLGALAAGALTVGIVAVQSSPSPSPSTEAAPTMTVAPTESSSPTPALTNADWDTTVKRLSEQSMPFTFTVLGDSTGNDRNEWVFLTAGWVSEEFNRPVEIHQWDSKNNEYTEIRTVGSGTGEPVTIWNSSSPGRTAAYTLEHLRKAAPERPDAVIINHGHNGGSAAGSQVTRLVNEVNDLWDEPPALAVTLQNPHTAEGSSKQRAMLSASLEDRYSNGPVKILDVRKAFEDTGDVAALLMDDGLHPNPAGSEVWAKVVIDSLP